MTPAELKLAREEAEAVLDTYRRTRQEPRDSDFYMYMVDSAVDQSKMVLQLLKELEGEGWIINEISR